MKNVKHFLLFLLILISSCKTPQKYFDRPKITPAINSNCTAFKNGEMIDATNYISVSPEDYETVSEYFDRREYCNYICLKYPRRCKGCK